ncbi:MAG: peptidyl-prolyl cis-trans isomerase, EpsD family [Candidatus Dactylopiibacterium carminicum]|uniref:peptidylprolyl isomerase n=1 Tax=Candidatus Dactylopiibacterium carminicum TaxID=857335 RepID=A0A272EPH3_9RHOO|nr:EpsD family peptidyl-prolyl cis-trans isomerase [Candidatus Dactylopiibacterium carminicum]KAF7598254.1 peptidyl-prolyl cis-trans isomerase, EpsD family [Candidatus Dactylopiibacterium carminicum]PAS91946.1 MAG: peptidyl-prolyl cis-trans isomerase, EpsD family [Candidatus Dactylopiibacterium carminicum]PAS94991.1 MAG: peptidyl-prolyl cis-trans isomerase, EpsD family [Candidatus Dactylopiibacterium carminicum]PAS97137.1 MAG: peptidyl-prolyl cis-trans isomerase, EpsD family [Candidatus Dactylo
MIRQTLRGLGLATLCSVALVACNKSAENKSASQVAVRVNGGEVSVHQLNFALQQARLPSTPENTAQVLDRLVDQEVAVQKALEKKLDRDPAVLQQIEAARREVLQRAWLERLAGEAPRPDDLQIKDYFAKHPELFTERRIYTYRLIAIQADAAAQPAVLEQVGKVSNFDELVVWLKQNDIRYSTDTATRAAEQIPMQLLPRMHQLKDGQVASITSPTGLELVQLLQSRQEPVNEAKARGMIEQFLFNQARADRIRTESQRLREKVSIEYLGDFHPPATQSAAAASVAQ